MAWSVQGNGGGAVAPPGLCILLNMKPARGTGRGQGRKFLGPLDKDMIQNNGTVNESFRNLVRDAADASIVQGAPGDGAFVLYTPPAGVKRDVVSVSVPNKFGMLQSRRD